MEGILIRNAPLIIYGLVMLVATVLSSVILTKRLRKRARHALGRNVSDSELTSINTWMEIENTEHQNRGYTTSSKER